MAFLPPAHPPPKAAVARESRARPANIAVQHQAIDDSQEWVLFSPSQYQQSPTLATEPTSRTAALSRLSDFGSLNTIGRTEAEDGELADGLEDEDELDSLDDGLHAFREPTSSSSHGFRRLDQSGGTILPAHDGLGTFPPTNAQVQEQLWHHERLNPRRRSYAHYRTLSSVQRRLEALDEEPLPDRALLDDNRMERIQKWRFDQSKIMSDEHSRASSRPASQHRSRSVDGGQLIRAGTAAAPPETAAENGRDGFWERITRTVIRNLMGIDENILSVILGESVVEDGRKGLAMVAEVPAPTTATPASRGPPEVPSGGEWETRLIRRIARELGNLVHHLSAPPPRALPAPLDMAFMDYAGIPVASENLIEEIDAPAAPSQDAAQRSAAFQPTLQGPKAPSDLYADDARAHAIAEREYWEQTPDLRSVFSYLTRRFLSRHRSTAHAASTAANLNESASGPNLVATHPSPASLHRATVIQQHHPLVARSRAAYERRRRNSLRLNQAGLRAAVAATLPGSLKRVGTSCASWSTKRSKLDGSEAGGSRNYWDIGGSLGSESLVLAGLGHWGEV